jgi:hypothetical protein
MSWHFSRELVAAYSAGICSDGVASALSSMNHSKVVFSCSDKMIKFCQRSPSGMMCERLTESDGEELLTLFLADFHAKTSAQQAGRIERD